MASPRIVVSGEHPFLRLRQYDRIFNADADAYGALAHENESCANSPNPAIANCLSRPNACLRIIAMLSHHLQVGTNATISWRNR